MSFRRYIAFRRSVAVLCMALAVMLSGQTYISLMDQVEHAHHHAHFANPLAGGVVCAEACGHQHEHGTQLASHHEHDGQPASHHHHDSHDSQGPADHQHGDATIMFLAAQSFVLPVCPVIADRCSSEPVTFASITPLGPEHPPKSTLEIRV